MKAGRTKTRYAQTVRSADRL